MSFERRERDERDDRLRATRSIEDDSFAHVLVDEAQDLSPLQWRMLARRGRQASWTIVGDPAQSSWPHPEESARARTEALEGKPEHVFRLSTNYRNSAEIYDLAAQVASVAVPDPDLADAVRRTGEHPEHHVVEASALPAEVVTRTEAMLAAVEGTVAVVTARADLESTAEALAALLARAPRAAARARGTRDEGPGVRRRRRGRARCDHRRVRLRLAHAVRRPHPRHPATHDRRQTDRWRATIA